ncbi:MAG TPA: type II toxin-antitoxin system VapC family toxin [Thermoanaerobaculia bacterium]|nr:type II toxin-antitoxin system VapC family toxin [Thermoanaerobaculia bacterium]
MILVDTSVWVDHLQKGVPALVEALEQDAVLTHPFVIGELACGNLKNRSEVLGLLAALPSAVIAREEETLVFIEERKLMGKGVGYIDAHLLASVTLTEGARLWTRDKRLADAAAELRLAMLL